MTAAQTLGLALISLPFLALEAMLAAKRAETTEETE